MKRIELKRKTPLKADPEKTRVWQRTSANTGLRRVDVSDTTSDRIRPAKRLRTPPGRHKWSEHPHRGTCQACGARNQILQAHHVLLAQYVRAVAPMREFDLANRMLIGLDCCHDPHHHHGVNDRRLPYDRVPEQARRFAREVIGEGPAMVYFWKRYRGAPNPQLQEE